MTGQSNQFKSSTDPIADGTYELRPIIGIRRPEANLAYSVEYIPSYEVFFKTDDVNGLDHFLRSTLDYDVLSVGQLHLGFDVSHYRAVRGESLDGEGNPDPLPATRGDINRIFATVGYDHQFRTATSLFSEVHVQRYAYTTPNNLDHIGVGGEIGLVREPNSIFAIGGSLAASWRDFEDKGIQPGSDNKIVNANVLVRARPFSTVTLEIQGGPAYIRTHQDGGHAARVPTFLGGEIDGQSFAAVYDNLFFSPDRCGLFEGQPVLSRCPIRAAPDLMGRFDEMQPIDYLPGQTPLASSDDQVTYFVSAIAQLDESWGVLSLKFQRGEMAAASVIATTVRDSLTASVNVGPWAYWSYRFRANWNRREMVDELSSPAVIAEDSGVPEPASSFNYARSSYLVADVNRTRRNVNQVWLDARASRAITDRLHLELGFRYLWQKRDEDASNLAREFDNIIGTLLLSYEIGKYEF